MRYKVAGVRCEAGTKQFEDNLLLRELQAGLTALYLLSDSQSWTNKTQHTIYYTLLMLYIIYY